MVWDTALEVRGLFLDLGPGTHSFPVCLLRFVRLLRRAQARTVELRRHPVVFPQAQEKRNAI